MSDSGSRWWLAYRGLLGPVMVLVLVGIAMLWSPFEPHRPPGADVARPPNTSLAEGLSASAIAAAGRGGSAGGPVTADWSDPDWDLFSRKIEWALESGVDTLPLGAAMATLGRSFVGTPYVPGTLDVEGPERLIVNFQGLDCVTFVENVFAMTRFVRVGGGELLMAGDRATAESVYASLLAEIRYRDARVGYDTRLHYFSDWIADNARRGLVDEVTPELGGVADTEPVDFMSSHPEAYRQLADPAFLDAIREREEHLTARGRSYLPQDRIAASEGGIRDGDIIAATSTVAGLDVAHTGLALWIDGRLHLLHAPLVGEAVQISEVPLADRIGRIEGQDGIMVARPVEERH